MRITIEIDANQLKQIQKITGHAKKSPAVSTALQQFLELDARQRFIQKVLAGKTDYAMTNDELEGLDVHETR